MQALLFGDGGILALVPILLCMAVVMPFVGYSVYKLLNMDQEQDNCKFLWLYWYCGCCPDSCQGLTWYSK